MKHLGITGGIAAGKSTVARMFARLGVPVFNADATIHQLYKQADIRQHVYDICPVVVNESGVDRGRLSTELLKNPALLDELEALLYPRLEACEAQFIRYHQRQHRALIVSDIPLMIEASMVDKYDKVLLVTAPLWLRQQRTRRKRGLSDEMFQFIANRQWPDYHKRRYADGEIRTGGGYAELARMVNAWHARLLTEDTGGENGAAAYCL